MSSSPAQLLQAGLEMHRAGRLQEAEAYYQAVRKLRPDHPDAWHLLGVLASQVGKPDVAVELVEKAIALNPEIPDFHVTAAEAYRGLRRYEAAIDSLHKALSLKPGFAGAHLNLGNVYREMGRLGEAEEHFRQAAALQPDFAVAHSNLGIVLRATGRIKEAVDSFSRAIEIMPGNFEAHNNLGNALFDLGRFADAERHYEQALAIRPDYAAAHSNLGNALKETGRTAGAMAHYRRAIAIQPDFAMAHCNLGTLLDDIGRPEEAIGHYEKALALQPDYAEAHNNLGNALDAIGRQSDAIDHYEKAVALKPGYAEAYRNLSRLKPAREQIPVLAALLEDRSLRESDAIHCHFALGGIHDHLGNYDEAFAHFDQGNALKRRSVNYERQKLSAHVDKLIQVYSGEYAAKTGAGGSASELPVFIVGMPRSGTSLVEQILSSHPRVHGGGELRHLVHIEEAIADRLGPSHPYPDGMPSLPRSATADYAGELLETLRGYSREALRITDKQPSNFLRVGLIRMLFPRARIIHCRRNALDTCTSNYLNYFAFGNEYSFDLEELGHYYLDYARLMAHWDAVFPGSIMTVQYEELVADPAGTSRRLVDHVGLEWDQRCLDFHRSQRAVNTFSSRQVRQPVYTGSVNRWRRYAKHLAPLRDILDTAG